MPELPEVETVVRTLAPLITESVFSSFGLYWPRTIQGHRFDQFRRELIDRRIQEVSRRAKFIVLTLDDRSRLTIHLRMTGELLYLPSDADYPPGNRKHLRAEFGFAGDDRLLFYDIRKFGRIRLLRQNEWDLFDDSVGIEPLSKAFTSDYLEQLLNDRKRQIKPLLLDQSMIAGIGNIYADESLFQARIHPLQRSDTISRSKVHSLRDAIVQILDSAITRRGTTLRDYRSGLGESGSNQNFLRVYGKPPGAPCPRCGHRLKRIAVAQRTTVLCPKCQRLRRKVKHT